jgi:amino acid adenylation domain-containing protein
MEPSGIHHLFEAQAQRTPEAVAVVQGNRFISYRELNGRANALACKLMAEGVRPDTLVGLAADRSVEMIAGILGILKAGGAYLPLDPTYPVGRLAFMASDAALRIVVAAPGQEAIAARLGAKVLVFPANDSDEPNPAPALFPECLAYVIYTSGSTGKPKGVAAPHAGLSALIPFTREEMQIGPGDRVLQFAAFSFDLSIWEIFAALTSGATLVLGKRDDLKPGPSLHKLMRRQEITLAVLTPSVLQILPPEGLDALRIVVASAEKLTGEIITRWQRPGRRFFNAYGPTEATIVQTIWEAPENGPCPDNPPIGQPTPGVEIYLMGEDVRPVKGRESGELCLAGVCLARGYVNRPDLTRERFITLPLGPSGEPVRVYRSGDRARRLPDGNLEFLGRMDLQVKVRGFRVEPGEVETALEQHPAVSSSAVVADREGSGLTRLWGYFVPRGADVPTVADLRAFLAQRLPDYMIPSGFTCLPHWPVTPNGKLDRRALPRPAQIMAESREMRPLTATEARLLDFCRDILGQPGLGVDAPLLQAGMHSLALAQLAWRIQHQFGIVPSFSQLFAQATVTSLARMMDELRAEKTTLAPCTIPAAPRAPDMPLSFAQKRIWFLEQLHPDNKAYHFQSVLRFLGKLDVSALETALNDLVRRHEVLRTAFPGRQGGPVQRVHGFTPFKLALDDVSKEVAQRRIDAAVRERFDLGVLPLVRWRLFRVAPEEHWLLHTEHHLLHDGWGYGIVLSELFALYHARTQGKPASLPRLLLQFADFAAWELDQMSAGRWDNQLDYWQAKLHCAPPPAELPADRPRPPVQTFQGAQLRVPLNACLYADLRAACAREGVTPYMWLHAAFQTFLHRYTGQADIVVGAGFANRKFPESRSLLGMIINTVALRTDLSGQPSFRELLARVRRAVLEAADNQDAPYDLVIRRLGARTALFNTFIDSYDQRWPSYQSDVLRVEREDVISNGTCKFDVVVLVIPGEATAATLLWEYNTDLFSEESASRMLRHFLALVAASIDQPELPVAALPMLSPAERERLLLVGRGTQTVLADRRIEEVFAEIAAARGAAPAVICQEERQTYGELNQRAEEIAAQLRAAGARPGGVAAFALPRSPQAIAVMLAILKCGCAYLPLDPKLPKARVDVLLGSARPSVLINAEGITRLEPTALPAEPVPRDAAYIMFTSGSTGAPKAVCAPHRAVIRLVCGVDYIRLDAQTRFLQLAPLSFDASTMEIWGPLLNGGTVVIHPEDLPDFAQLGRTIAGHGVTTAWLTSSLFNQVITTAPTTLRPLQELLTGGEALSVPHVLRALAELPDTKLINGYGPTETTTFATSFRIPRDFDPAARRVPIGRPIPNTQVYVLNELGQPQPIGAPGELFIGGHGLAFGYLGDEQLTATRFVSDPFSERPGARLYRTGDRCRWLPDGTLDFIERCDRQLKIHGFRIEPGEIESVLAQHSAVRESFVTASEEAAGERRLAAYVVLQPPHAADELRRFLKDRLPDYMAPAQIVVLDALPKTPNGKIDHRALPPPGPLDREIKAVGAPARTPLEEVVAGIWANVLKRDRVGVQDDFFLTGGDSLLALQLIHELNAAFGLQLPVRLLFDEPTAAGQAREIERALASRRSPSQERRGTYAPLAPLRPGGNKPPFFLVAGGFGGEAELLVYAKLARYLDRQQPLYGLRARGVDELAEPHQTVELMAAEHVREICTIQPHGPYFIGGSCVGGVVALEVAQQLRAHGEPIGLLVLVDTQFPTWQAMLRNRLHNLWCDQVLPFLRRCSASGREFRAAIRESTQLLFAPTREQKIGRQKVRIGRKYLRHILRYKPRPYPGPVTLIMCEKPTRREPGRVWHDLAGGGLEILHVPGDHFTHLREHVQATAARIGACLDAAQARKMAA